MKHTLSLLGRNLVAGAFLLLGFSANTQVVSADVFILQGEKGDAGAKGDIGDNKFTDADAALLKALLPKLKASGSKLVITADEISFESTAGTEAGKITIDSAKKELTFSTGTTVFSLTSTQITANASQISLTTPTFEVKGTATNPTTSLTLDDTARSIALRVTQKNAAIQAAFSLEGGDANTSPAPATKYPLAIFNRTNIQVQSGEGSTTATLNGLGNLILGYNSKTKSTTALRTGSHNLIVGDDHDYQNYGGFVSGSQNILIGGFSTVAGGSGSTASGTNSTVAGGSGSTASGTNSTVAGGSGNEAGRDGSSICSSVNVKVRSTDPSAAPVRYCCGNAGP